MAWTVPDITASASMDMTSQPCICPPTVPSGPVLTLPASLLPSPAPQLHCAVQDPLNQCCTNTGPLIPITAYQCGPVPSAHPCLHPSAPHCLTPVFPMHMLCHVPSTQLLHLHAYAYLLYKRKYIYKHFFSHKYALLHSI